MHNRGKTEQLFEPAGNDKRVLERSKIQPRLTEIAAQGRKLSEHDPKLAEVEEKVSKAIDSDQIPKLYGNSFILRLTNADLSLVLVNNGRPVAVISLSYTLAKTLAQRLGLLLSKLESRTGREMLTTDQVDVALTKEVDEGDENKPH